MTVPLEVPEWLFGRLDFEKTLHEIDGKAVVFLATGTTDEGSQRLLFTLLRHAENQGQWHVIAIDPTLNITSENYWRLIHPQTIKTHYKLLVEDNSVVAHEVMQKE